MIQPRPVVKTDRIDNENIPFPMAGRPAEPSRIGIFRKGRPIGPDLAEYTIPFEDLKQSAGNLKELAQSVEHHARISLRITHSQRIVSDCGRNCSGTVRGFVGIELSL